MKKTRIILVEPLQLLADSIQAIFQQKEKMEVVAPYQSGDDCIHHLTRRFPDLLLISQNLPDMNGLECCRQIHLQIPQLPILIWGNDWSASLLHIALQHGARGILEKTIDSHELYRLIQMCLKGMTVFSSGLTERFLFGKHL